MLMIIRKEGEKVTRYVHLGSGNYNEQTSRIYTDVSLLTTNDVYGHDVSEFFNVITGHSQPDDYEYLITAPKDMRQQLIHLIREEVRNAKKGLPSGIVMKMNSLEDKEMIDEFYKASKAGVPIRFIVRGICCLRPGRPGLSENIEVRSIVGDYLEHSRLFYFHHGGQPKVYAGSADLMVRSFDRRIEALFLIVNPALKREAINILYFNLKDNQNTYLMREDGAYVHRHPAPDEPVFNVHKEFYHRHYASVAENALYEEWLTRADVQTDNAASNEGPPLTAPDFPADTDSLDADFEVEMESNGSDQDMALSGGEMPDAV
jgi:polyphosphate kinase